MTAFIRRLGAIVCAFTIGGTAAHATPVNIVEGGTDFDVAAPFGEVLGTLGVGTNTISGSIDFTCTGSSTRCGIGGAGG